MLSSKPPAHSPPPSGGNTFTLRLMTAADHDVVGRVGWESWRSTGPLDRGFADPKVGQRVKNAFLRFPSTTNGHVVVADMDGCVVGWGAREDEPDYISDIWIAPDFQRRGIGAGLVQHFCAVMHSEGLRQARIATHQKNYSAIALYKRCGFDIVWQGMEHDSIMGLELPKVRLKKLLF
ncbi:GNAT family N-acetyltransferase [Allorhizobium terrae]|uniref:GNAT family N-acetyltransferase n=2 Tax=Allorhizobium terrae TaxID=1848972 RepID=A0A4S4A1Q8_9HYPH|nr:GNAT family N-acetyltransferase [Allorhizobium terrae]